MYLLMFMLMLLSGQMSLIAGHIKYLYVFIQYLFTNQSMTKAVDTCYMHKLYGNLLAERGM